MSTAAVPTTEVQPTSDAQRASTNRPSSTPSAWLLDAFRGFIMFWIVGGAR
jgi:hypothetical protein